MSARGPRLLLALPLTGTPLGPAASQAVGVLPGSGQGEAAPEESVSQRGDGKGASKAKAASTVKT